METVYTGDDIIVGTLSKNVSASKLLQNKVKVIGSIIAMLPANAPSGLFPEGPKFTWADIHNLISYISAECANMD